MIGRQIFVVFIEKFRKVRKTFSCQKGNQSPSHSVGTPLDLTEAKPSSIINTNSEPVEEEEMGNKPLKLPDIDSSIHQDRVLDIIKEQKTPLKETNFSPYTPLPAIGKSSLEGAKRKIVRQKTYRVLEPVYIKGPSDLYKYISNADNLVTESNFKKARKSLNAGDQRNKHSEVFKTLKHADNNSQDTENSSDALNVHLKERDTKPVGFCKSAPGQITKSVNVNNKIDFKSKKSKNVDKENATAFWIDF